jgi:murein DD-endopeptidase MepM/ murein hydrolase activator NlpD
MPADSIDTDDLMPAMPRNRAMRGNRLLFSGSQSVAALDVAGRRRLVARGQAHGVTQVSACSAWQGVDARFRYVAFATALLLSACCAPAQAALQSAAAAHAVDYGPHMPAAVSAQAPVLREEQLTVGPGDSLARLFRRAGLDDDQWLAVRALGLPAGPLLYLQPGRSLQLRKNPRGKLESLRLAVGDLSTLMIARRNGRLVARMRHHRPDIHRVRVSALIEHSLSGALLHAGADQATAARVTAVLGERVNLARAIYEGDRITAIFEQPHLEGRRLADGALLAVELDLHGQVLRAFRRRDADDTVRFYDLDGRSYQQVIERTLVQYTRVSSPFSLHRCNPVTHWMMPHYGVDLAAPRGTPIHVAAADSVHFRGRAHGYGRLVELDHPGDYQTRYAHMSAFASGLHAGDHVNRDQLIGYVGASGHATGPHLHYEIRHHGIAHDPLTIVLPGRRLTGDERVAYQDHTASIAARLRVTAGEAPQSVGNDIATTPEAAGHSAARACSAGSNSTPACHS